LARYGCFEIRTSCSGCGQPVPVNGPFREVTCSSCFSSVRIPPDIIAGFMNDFEEEYEGRAEGEGSGGTLMSGSGTYKYGQWRLAPRCSLCKKPLVLPDSPGEISCECGAKYFCYETPEWLAGLVPSLRQCISQEAPSSEGTSKDHVFTGESQKPVVMSCPQCSGALSITAASDRIMSCRYCDSEVYIPDAVWTRLHPVKKVQEWFACFEGRTEKQIAVERRLKDKKDEEEELKTWKRKTAPKRVRNRSRPYLIYVLGLAGLYLLTSAVVSFARGIGLVESIASLVPVFVMVAFIGIPLSIAFSAFFSGAPIEAKNCREAMAKLATAHGWEHSGTEYKRSIGSIRDKYKGRDIEIDPGDDYAIEIEVEGSTLFLKTEPPGFPPEDLRRFTTGNSVFDRIFPFRYAEPGLASRIESSPGEAGRILAPVFIFLDRWGARLGMMKVDWSSVSVHITPGCYEIMDMGGRYLPAEDLEPLFEDTVKLARGIEAISSGREQA